MFLFRTVNGLEKIASQEICERLSVTELTLHPYGPRGWIRCEIEGDSLQNARTLRSTIEAYLILNEEGYSKDFSIDRFADTVIERIRSIIPQARSISISAYSAHRSLNQREIQGAFSKRVREKLNAECNLKDYDTALRVTLLKKVAIAAIDLKIQPGNLPQKLVTHPTPLLPPIAYCMIRLASPKKGEQLLDPMCGCGTIPLIAALEWTNLKVAGSDILGGNIECARRNAVTLGLADKVKFLVGDVADLPFAGIRADLIVVNPPYGISVPSPSQVEKLYWILFEASSKILSNEGRIVTITPYPEIVEKAVSTLAYKVVSVYEVREGEPPRTIHVIRKV
jgi:23S rRNA G2445 N2-methylase RlmL